MHVRQRNGEARFGVEKAPRSQTCPARIVSRTEWISCDLGAVPRSLAQHAQAERELRARHVFALRAVVFWWSDAWNFLFWLSGGTVVLKKERMGWGGGSVTGEKEKGRMKRVLTFSLS